DMRFQTDNYFPYICFNHEQIRESATGGYLLTERSNFARVSEKILGVDRNVLDKLMSDAKIGRRSELSSESEKNCMEVISLLDHVSCKVPGSISQRRFQRNEIKSMIIAYNVPMFFITFAPADHKNPLCLYYCGLDIDLLSNIPDIPSYIERMNAVAENPVACARFFDLLVKTFIKCILRWEDKQGRDGLFGQTLAYYGTVE
ncbi:uncharacterized protein TRAVEDRAFT_75877, partial [Trametes versicolor FP-101664 SS1]|uniref:uncharacterized protein n=1 Tax=Trametes versicolor (strain FP-101664) TaxID=717944 RepID=UPI0004624A03